LVKSMPHPASPIAFSGNPLWRLSEKRGADSLAEAISHPLARFICVSEGKPVIERRSEEAVECHFSLKQIQPLDPDLASAVLLGFLADAPHIAVPVPLAPDRLPAPFDASDIRPLFAGNLLPGPVLGEIAQASSLLSWNASCRFCGACGAGTRPESAGYKRVCESCGKEHFPRTDPVTIMLVTRGETCLLARSARFPENMVSCLAGFIEPGETIEEAVRRETLEEAGIRTGAVTYVASQPWPFPHSLMIGCTAQALNSDIVLEEDELESGGWFTRDDVRAMIEGSHEEGWQIPPEGSIAHYLIRGWAENL
jgi:NAD+ diphosphatase